MQLGGLQATLLVKKNLFDDPSLHSHHFLNKAPHMASSERPHYLPPLKLHPEESEHEEDDAGPAPLPRTASSVHSGALTGLSRSTSTASRARSGQTSHAPRSPSAYSTTFTIPSSSGHHGSSQPPPPSSTHAGGILPAASFFHPSRPTYYTDFGPMSQLVPGNNSLNAMPMGTVTRSTSLSYKGDPRPESGGSDSFAQASLTSDEPVPGITGRERSNSASQSANAPANVARGFSVKKSREPLLPIGQKPKTTVPTPRIGVNASGSATKLPGISSYGRWGDGNSSKGGEEGGLASTFGTGAGGRVRTSLEKFLRRTLSNDTQMAQDTSFVKDSMQPLEEIEIGGRNSEDPYIEFKTSPNAMFDEEGTINITRHNVTAPSTISRRQLYSLQRPHFPDFNPVPPPTTPSLARTPKLDASGKPVRKYRLHPSSNTFFLKGKLLTGGDSVWPFVCSLVVVFGLAGAWSGATAVWWWKNESPAVAIIGAYLCLITIANMFVTVSLFCSKRDMILNY